LRVCVCVCVCVCRLCVARARGGGGVPPVVVTSKYTCCMLCAKDEGKLFASDGVVGMHRANISIAGSCVEQTVSR